MSQPVADRNLLFGVLAMQMDFINREQLIAAMQAWVFDKSKPLGEILKSQKALAEDNRALLEALVQKHLAMHDNNAEKSLAAVSSVGSVKKDLEKIADQDVQASLVHVSTARAKDEDIYKTIAPAKIGGGTGMRFRIVRPHAKGGLGEVWIAHDEELHREVALKEIQEKQADNLESRSRFMIEAEITGGLEHPGIVPVYGLGTYGDGRPYYAMRFIRGDSLKDAVDRFHKLDVAGMDAGTRTLEMRGLLGRFVDVCNAISYAHSRGVLHRDLKPGNIMLGKYGETLVVDWGLAKPMGQALEKTERIEPGEGSLIPHSISGSSQTLAGSALGTPQYMSPEQAAGRHDQLGPASDVYSLGATLYCVLTGQAPFGDRDVGTVLQKVQRGEFPKPTEIKGNVPLPLEAVCRKAMALLPMDRYATPTALANDIEHWLADEPVSAWPEPWTVKTRRWVGRHTALVAGVASAVAIALVSLVIATVMLTAANERERQARKKADENFQMAQDAVDKYLNAVKNEDLLNNPGMEPLRRKLLESAREFNQKFVEARKGDPAVQADLARATYRLAQITGDLDSELDAIKLYEEAVQLLETLPADKTTVEMRGDLATCYHHLGRLHRLTVNVAKSQASYEKAQKMWQKLFDEQPKEERFRDGLARTELGLGNLHQLLGRVDEAKKLYEQAAGNWESLRQANQKAPGYRRDVAVARYSLAIVSRRMGGDEAETKKALTEAASDQKRLVDEAPNIEQYQNDLAKTEFGRGDYQEAAKRWQMLVGRHPAVTPPHKTLADVYLTLGSMPGDAKKNEEYCQQAVTIFRKLADNHPGVPSYQGDLARGLSALANARRMRNLIEQAGTDFEECIKIQERLIRDLPVTPHYQRDLAMSYNGIGFVHAQNKNWDAAEDAYKKALARWDTLLKDQPRERDYRQGKSASYEFLGHLFSARQKYADAVGWYDQALATAQDKAKPTLRFWRASAQARAGNYAEAAKDAQELVANAQTGNDYYRFAALYSLASAAAAGDTKRIEAERQKFAKEYAEQAGTLLGSAFKDAGFRTPANLQKLDTDPDLHAVRSRPEMKKLLDGLKASGS